LQKTQSHLFQCDQENSVDLKIFLERRGSLQERERDIGTQEGPRGENTTNLRPEAIDRQSRACLLSDQSCAKDARQKGTNLHQIIPGTRKRKKQKIAYLEGRELTSNTTMFR